MQCSRVLAASTSRRICEIDFSRRFLLLKLQLWQTEVCSRLRQNLLVGVAYVLVMIGRAGMDSSRSGLLSTLLMTLPLIVVPAVALLRPPGHVGMATVDLAASDGEEVDSLFEGFPDFEADTAGGTQTETAGHSDPDGIQQHDPGSKAESDISGDPKSPDGDQQKNLPPGTSRPPDANKDPFLPDDRTHAPPPTERHDIEPSLPSGSDLDTVKADVGKIVEQLNAMGALNTMWFEAGDKTPVGLAVFFRGSQELTRFRFEAVGESREACARDVLEQVTRWQQQNAVQ